MSDPSQPLHLEGVEALELIVLAAGAGKRMRSSRPKPMQVLAGRTLLQHVLETVALLNPARIHVVIGHGADQIRDAFADRDDLTWVFQAEQRGTGHAVSMALPGVDSQSTVVVAYGDVPLVRAETLAACATGAASQGVSLVTADFADPVDLGRIERGPDGAVLRIVEFKNASAEQRAIREINSGIIGARADLLAGFCERLQANELTGELYLTDIIEMAVDDGLTVEGIKAASEQEAFGVNDRAQLAELERLYQLEQVRTLHEMGVSTADAARVDVRGKVTAGQDSFVDVNVVLCGNVTFGERVTIGAGCVITDSVIGDDVVLHPHCVIDNATIESGAEVGPFARLRPGAALGADTKVGNFVEIKNSRVGRGSKASHLAYLGDSDIGSGVNVGAGAITCNYDGKSKHPTNIGDGAFVGSNVTLVAPVTVEAGAYLGAGSTITRSVPEDHLGVSRVRQRNLPRRGIGDAAVDEQD